MKTDSTKPLADAAEGNIFLGENWFDPLEEGVRSRIRGFIEELLEAELDAALARKRYQRPSPAGSSNPAKTSATAGHRNGHRERQLLGTCGPASIRIPRARLTTPDGKTTE